MSRKSLSEIAKSLNDHFGDLIPAEFRTLPALDFTQIPLILSLVQNTLTSNADYSPLSLFEKIKTDVALNLKFMTFLKNNSYIIQALFDRYCYERNKNLPHTQPLLSELRDLLKSITPLVNNKKFDAQLASLEKQDQQPVALSADVWDQLPETLPEHERVKRLFAHVSQENASTLSSRPLKRWILAEGTHYEEIPIHMHVPGTSLKGGKFGIWHTYPYLFDNDPSRKSINQPGVFTKSMMILFLASGYADINSLSRATLKNYLAPVLQQADTCSHPLYRQGGTNYHQISNRSSNTLPPEYVAILASANNKNGIFKKEKLQATFKYFVFIFYGQLNLAKEFLEKLPAGFSVDHTCLLFLAAIMNRFDIFENFVKKYPLPENFNFSVTAEGGSLTPLMFAKQLGNKEAVDVLSKNRRISAITESENNADSTETVLRKINNQITQLSFRQQDRARLFSVPRNVVNEAAPAAFCCPITAEIMRDPVITPDGITYERKAISDWIALNQTDPTTRNRLTLQDLRPNRALQDLIERWKTHPLSFST